jgi:predicted SnoaL-like aldol condensation-catalyzing enzyme
VKAQCYLLLLGALALPVQAEPLVRCEGEEGNLQTYLQMHEILFTERDTSRVADFYAPQVVSHNNDRGGGAARVIVTPKSMAEFWDRSREHDPDRVLEDELILCVDDFVIVRTLVKKNFVFPLAGVEPTGEAYQYTATDIYRFENGKVVERWGNNDMANVYRQLGFTISRD